jgi:nitrogen-specific signal transduction histidine kinase
MKKLSRLLSLVVCLSCLEQAYGTGEAICNFEHQYASGKEITVEVCREAAREITNTIGKIAQSVPQHIFDPRDDVDLYIDDGTEQQSDLVTLLEQLRCVEEKMPEGRGKEMIHAVVEKYDASGVGNPSDFVDLCRNVSEEMVDN